MASSASLDSLIVCDKDFERYNGHHYIEKFELPRPRGSANTTAVNSGWSSDHIVNWLRQPPDQEPSLRATMKMLMIQTHNQLTGKKSHGPHTTDRDNQVKFVKDIFANMALPLAAFGAYIKAHITFVCVPPNSADNHEKMEFGTRYYCSGTSWAIAWAYFPTLRHTAAVMFHREGDGDQRREEVIQDLLRLQSHRGHHMLLGYVKTKISLAFTFDMLDDMNRETLKLEKEIGFPTWDWVLDKEVSGGHVSDSHDSAIAKFNVLSGKLTNIRFRLRTFQQQIKFISRCNAQHRGSLSADDVLSKQECSELDAMMDVIWDYTNVHLFDADSLAERLHNQMQSVFQLTTQRDSRASLAFAEDNHELARQGKATNSSMMTIAFVTLLFLPGTFVASFFDTPIFNWRPTERDGVLVFQPFWIYWTVSGLLTVSLCVGWFEYLRRRRVKDRESGEAARMKFRDRIRERQRVFRRQHSSEELQESARTWLSRRLCPAWFGRRRGNVAEHGNMVVVPKSG